MIDQSSESEKLKNSIKFRILIIEDEKIIMEMQRAFLEKIGYNTLEASTGKEALHISETFKGKIDLAILDIKLPDIDGIMVFNRLIKLRPNLKVIFSSGYAVDGPVRQILKTGAQGFIQKPFSFEALSKKLEEVLKEG